MGEKRFYRSDSVIAFPTVDGYALHDIEDDLFYEFDSEVAKDIWELLNGDVSVKSIISMIQKDYDIDEVTLEKDVYSFIVALLENGLICEC